ncbi:hypothetical protein T12_11996 [Trichinella patagoniensis]|uniref:Uncharacterized protein n=1 Tax=Trichinella patagoniensis TaxID=990121 RepID=A0A0V0ZGF8_9BILA|nr:hypothetical protein T12_11996 [Trichinella patagoniensis]
MLTASGGAHQIRLQNVLYGRMDNAWLSIAFLTLVPRAPLFKRTGLMHWDALHHITWFQILPAVATKSRTTAYHPHSYALAERMNMESVH